MMPANKTHIKYLETLNWQPMVNGANESCLFWAKDTKNIYMAGGGLKDGKLQINIARVIETPRYQRRQGE